jgi:hypothetical protein
MRDFVCLFRGSQGRLEPLDVAMPEGIVGPRHAHADVHVPQTEH